MTGSVTPTDIPPVVIRLKLGNKFEVGALAGNYVEFGNYATRTCSKFRYRTRITENLNTNVVDLLPLEKQRYDN